MNAFLKIQNKALRAILKKNRFESISVMLNELDLLSVKQRVTYNTLKLIYKAIYVIYFMCLK